MRRTIFQSQFPHLSLTFHGVVMTNKGAEGRQKEKPENNVLDLYNTEQPPGYRRNLL